MVPASQTFTSRPAWTRGAISHHNYRKYFVSDTSIGYFNIFEDVSYNNCRLYLLNAYKEPPKYFVRWASMRKIFDLTAGLNIWVMNQIFGLIKKWHNRESNPHIDERTNVQTPYWPGYEGFILVQIHLHIPRLFSACYTILGHPLLNARHISVLSHSTGSSPLSCAICWPKSNVLSQV